MNTREIAKEYRLSHWAQIMKARSESGLSIKAFCKEAGFHENVYYYWQRKLREAACELAVRTSPKPTAPKALIPNGWAMCETTEPEAKCGALTIEVGTYRVRVEPGDDLELVGKVCRMLAAL